MAKSNQSAETSKRHDACEHCVYLRQYLSRQTEHQLDNYILAVKHRISAERNGSHDSQDSA